MLALLQVNNKQQQDIIYHRCAELGVFVVIDEGKEKRPALVAEQVL